MKEGKEEKENGIMKEKEKKKKNKKKERRE